MDCIFCKIVQKEIPSSVIFEDENFVAFKDISPKAPIHVLVVPKRHVSSLIDVKAEDEKMLGQILLTVHKVGEKFGLGIGGYKVIMNNGEGSGQIVPHLHLHILGGWKQNPDWEV